MRIWMISLARRRALFEKSAPGAAGALAAAGGAGEGCSCGAAWAVPRVRAAAVANQGNIQFIEVPPDFHSPASREEQEYFE
jgi:hypothetical protein